MTNIAVDESTYEKLRFSAALMGCSIGEVVRMLVTKLDGNTAPTSIPTRRAEIVSEQATRQPLEPVSARAGWVRVYRVFKGQRFEAEFNPGTLEVRLNSSPWSGKVFPSPTAAAQAVVAHVPGKRETVSTNGRTFWRLDPGGDDLRSIIGQRF